MRHFSTMAAGFAALVLTAGCESSPTDATTARDGRTAGNPSFVHESNNRAELSGSQNGNILGGHVIINFVKGNGWRSTVNVKGDLAAGTYSLYTTHPTFGEQLVCSFTVIGTDSRQGCSSDTNVPGFAAAEVRDESGTVVASGGFARRGGARF